MNKSYRSTKEINSYALQLLPEEKRYEIFERSGEEVKETSGNIEEFKNEVEGGLFIDDDGYGYYATDTTKSDIYVYPSDFTENIYRDDFTHIIWFNR